MKRAAHFEEIRRTLKGFVANGELLPDGQVIAALLSRVDDLTTLLIGADVASQCSHCGTLYPNKPPSVITVSGDKTCHRCAAEVVETLEEELYRGAIHQLAAHVAISDAYPHPEWIAQRSNWIVNNDVAARVAEIKSGASKKDISIRQYAAWNA
jgi:hypothetical protein